MRFLALVTAVACTPVPEATYDDFLAESERLNCAALERCEPTTFAEEFDSIDACITAGLQESGARTCANFEPRQAENCLGELEDLLSTCDLSERADTPTWECGQFWFDCS